MLSGSREQPRGVLPIMSAGKSNSPMDSSKERRRGGRWNSRPRFGQPHRCQTPVWAQEPRMDLAGTPAILPHELEPDNRSVEPIALARSGSTAVGRSRALVGSQRRPDRKQDMGGPTSAESRSCTHSTRWAAGPIRLTDDCIACYCHPTNRSPTVPSARSTAPPNAATRRTPPHLR